MIKDFIPYEQALELKELGFNERCFNHYSERDGESLLHLLSATPIKNESFITYKGCAAPLYQQAFRWFREKFNMPSKIEATFEHETPNQYHYFYQIVTDDFIAGDGVMLNWTYEEAELACLKKLIEIVKTNEIS